METERPLSYETFKTDKDFDHAFFQGRQQCDYPECPWCARLFLTWLRLRLGQMAAPRVKLGETVSFAEAAATSNIPEE